MTRRSELESRAVGCIVGLACGDALARPVAGLRGAEVARRHGEIRTYVEVPPEENEPHRLALRGLHGATTTACLALLDSLLYAEMGPSGADFARRLTALSFPRNRHLPWGALRTPPPALVRAVDAHARGDDWRLAGVREPDAAAILAAVPLGLLCGDDLDEVVAVAVEVTLVCHREPRSLCAAAAMVGMVRHTVENRQVSRHGLVRAALGAAEIACREMAERHRGVIAGSPDQALTALSMALANDDPLQTSDLDVRDAPEVALACVVNWCADRPLLDALAAIVSRGGSADLLAPAVGALLGARAGGAHLPLGLVEGLAAHREIEMRARALFGPRPPALRPLYDIEIALALREGEWREARPPLPPFRARRQLDLL